MADTLGIEAARLVIMSEVRIHAGGGGLYHPFAFHKCHTPCVFLYTTLIILVYSYPQRSYSLCILIHNILLVFSYTQRSYSLCFLIRNAHTPCAFLYATLILLVFSQLSRTYAIYGIGIDPRHLQLLADVMTYRGEVRISVPEYCVAG